MARACSAHNLPAVATVMLALDEAELRLPAHHAHRYLQSHRQICMQVDLRIRDPHSTSGLLLALRPAYNVNVLVEIRHPVELVIQRRCIHLNNKEQNLNIARTWKDLSAWLIWNPNLRSSSSGMSVTVHSDRVSTCWPLYAPLRKMEP